LKVIDIKNKGVEQMTKVIKTNINNRLLGAHVAAEPGMETQKEAKEFKIWIKEENLPVMFACYNWVSAENIEEAIKIGYEIAKSMCDDEDGVWSEADELYYFFNGELAVNIYIEQYTAEEKAKELADEKIKRKYDKHMKKRQRDSDFDIEEAIKKVLRKNARKERRKLSRGNVSQKQESEFIESYVTS
jgi:hypothetical protein